MNSVFVDPGKDGGIAIFKNDKLLKSYSMPIRRIEIKPKRMVYDLDYSTSKSGKKQYIKSGLNKGKVKMKLKTPAKYAVELNSNELFEIFKKSDLVVLEKQNPRPGNSAATSATTMKNYGKLLALAEISGSKLIEIAPLTWKKALGLELSKEDKKVLTNSEYKKMSISKANGLYNIDIKKDGIADAICIGYYYHNMLDQ